MLNVYIKSFARPFYLDRCIRSVKFNINKYDKIVILDDGSQSVHLERIRQLHPDVEIRSSGADDGKFELLRQGRFDEIAHRYPSAPAFWVREIAADDKEYCLVMEDDAWIVRRLDLPALVHELKHQEALICKLWWGSQAHKIIAKSSCPTGPVIEYYEADCADFENARSIWIVAFAIFRRDYWLRCVSRAKRLGDERSQVIAACEFAQSSSSARFAKSQKRAVYQGWIIPARSTSEYYDKGLIQHAYMDVLNDAWFAGEIDVTEGYPFDFPEQTIVRLMGRRLPAEAIDAWREWQRREVVHYYDC
jgi:hypothetical protein